MNRRIWKWIFGISLVLLILLMVFTLFVWVLGNATGAMAGAIMGSLDPENFGYHYLSLGQFLANFVGSPMFFIALALLAAHIASVAALIVTRRRDP